MLFDKINFSLWSVFPKASESDEGDQGGNSLQ
jgi:hypothetical protein